MLKLPSSWVWDLWVADDGDQFHLFFLKASRALIDPGRRHRRASIGHAVSDDLYTWTETDDAIVAADEPAWDDLATWTGSVVRGDDDVWRLFYTGVNRADRGLVQRIGVATSIDLSTWQRNGVLLESDPRWYETLADGQWPDEAWRDPWVYPDPAGDGWHMLITARANRESPDQRGVIGHAWTPSLDHDWQIRPPLSTPGAGFGHLEVPQVANVEGRPVLLFSCSGAEVRSPKRDVGQTGGIWAVEATSVRGPFDIAEAHLLADQQLYGGRLVRDRAGQWQLLAFRNDGSDGRFIGDIIDPRPVRWNGTRLTVGPPPVAPSEP